MNELQKPKAKPVAKAVPKRSAAVAKAAPKKLTQSTLTAKPAPKKRPKSTSDDEDDKFSELDVTPPTKKARQAPAKKSSSKVLAPIENDRLVLDDSEDDQLAIPNAKGDKKTASDTYQKLTQLEHIIKRPDTYIGSVERTEQMMWVLNKETMQMEHRMVGFVPGLYKIFDEIMVNAADNKQRDPTMTSMKITIDRAAGIISVENDGEGIPIVMHEVSRVSWHVA